MLDYGCKCAGNRCRKQERKMHMCRDTSKQSHMERTSSAWYIRKSQSAQATIVARRVESEAASQHNYNTTQVWISVAHPPHFTPFHKQRFFTRYQPIFPCWIACRIGFDSFGSAPVFSRRSNSTNSFSASRSFSSSDISICGAGRSATPVIGLIGTPAGVVEGAEGPAPDAGGGGALMMPLLKRKPATFP